MANFASITLQEADCINGCPAPGFTVTPAPFTLDHSVQMVADTLYFITLQVQIDPNPSNTQLGASVDSTFSTSATGGFFSFSQPPILGDYNHDGVVDAADYTVWRDTLGSTTDLRANGDNTGASAGVIDLADYAFWTSHFGNHAGSGAGAAIPEPSTDALLVIGCVVALVAPRRRIELRVQCRNGTLA
jgi:hypothetical protein